MSVWQKHSLLPDISPSKEINILKQLSNYKYEYLLVSKDIQSNQFYLDESQADRSVST